MNSILLFLNMSGGEILVIVLVAYLVLGPKKIPEVARMVGKGINELRRATDDIRTEITREVNNIKKEANLDFKDTLSWAVASGGFTCYYIGGTFLETYAGEKLKRIKDFRNDYLKQIGSL